MSEPFESAAALAALHVRYVHEHVLAAVSELTDEQLAWRPGPTAPGAWFHLWHVARWADRLQAALPSWTPGLAERLGPAAQVWESEGLAAAWGFTPELLGWDQTGMEMGDEASATLPFPGPSRLLGYARQALGACDRAAGFVSPEDFHVRIAYDDDRSVGDAILGHAVHAARHLGMIEALRGVQGLHGSATV